MDKQKILDELEKEVEKIDGNDNRFPADAFWAGHLLGQIESIKSSVENYDQERAEKNYY